MLFFGQRGFRVIAHDQRGHGRSTQAWGGNPGGLPLEVFDSIRNGVATNRAQTFMDITLPFYGFNRPGAKVSEGIRERWWLQGMMGGIKAHYDCIKAFSETDAPSISTTYRRIADLTEWHESCSGVLVRFVETNRMDTAYSFV